MKFSGGIFHRLLIRELHHDGPEDEMRFLLGHHSARFSKIEFCLITGLKFGVMPNMLTYGMVENGIHQRYFEGRDDINYLQLRATLRIDVFTEQYDAVKMCLLYMLNWILMGLDEREKVPGLKCNILEKIEDSAIREKLRGANATRPATRWSNPTRFQTRSSTRSFLTSFRWFFWHFSAQIDGQDSSDHDGPISGLPCRSFLSPPSSQTSMATKLQAHLRRPLSRLPDVPNSPKMTAGSCSGKKPAFQRVRTRLQPPKSTATSGGGHKAASLAC
ncbi:hypothetical protein Q3G72_030026 [Acer saccharum]|nr:hypothetical protein Q3G72_030026 [Acer saccharum]